MPEMSSVFEAGSKAVSSGQDAISGAKEQGSFLTAGGAQSVAGVDSSAAQALAVSQKAPDMIISIGTAGVKLAIEAVKVLLVASGVGAGLVAVVDGIETAVSKGLDKMKASKSEASQVNKEARGPATT